MALELGKLTKKEQKLLKEDMENLLAYAHGNDQCDDDDFKEMDKIAERWNLEK